MLVLYLLIQQYEDGKCLFKDNYVYKDDNSKMNNDPSVGDGWGLYRIMFRGIRFR